MSMDNAVQVAHIASSWKKVLWTREMELKFLDLLHEQVQLGRRTEWGFKKEAWTAIEKRFNRELKLNLSKENFKNKMKTWKQSYRLMKELKNTSGFEWNETTQSMDADERVWDELLKRKEYRNAKVFMRQPFKYYNDLAFIVGNDLAEGNTAATAQKTEEGHPMVVGNDMAEGNTAATAQKTEGGHLMVVGNDMADGKTAATAQKTVEGQPMVVGNDMAEDNTAATAHKTEERHPMDEALNLNDDEDIGTPLETAADLDDEDITTPISNQSGVSGKRIRSTSLSRRPKRKKTRMASFMDGICETINKLHEGLSKPQIIKVDQSHLDKVLDDVYDVLKAIPELSLTTMLVAYDAFLVEPARAKGFLRLTQEERVKYIQMKFGGH